MLPKKKGTLLLKPFFKNLIDSLFLQQLVPCDTIYARIARKCYNLKQFSNIKLRKMRYIFNRKILIKFKFSLASAPPTNP